MLTGAPLCMMCAESLVSERPEDASFAGRRPAARVQGVTAHDYKRGRPPGNLKNTCRARACENEARCRVCGSGETQEESRTWFGMWLGLYVPTVSPRLQVFSRDVLVEEAKKANKQNIQLEKEVERQQQTVNKLKAELSQQLTSSRQAMENAMEQVAQQVEKLAKFKVCGQRIVHDSDIRFDASAGSRRATVRVRLLNCRSRSCSSVCWTLQMPAKATQDPANVRATATHTTVVKTMLTRRAGIVMIQRQQPAAKVRTLGSQSDPSLFLTRICERWNSMWSLQHPFGCPSRVLCA